MANAAIVHESATLRTRPRNAWNDAQHCSRVLASRLPPRLPVRHQRCSSHVPEASGNADAPKFNPQNTENALVGPTIDADAVEAVMVQLEALRNNDTPWWNHGVQTAYEYGVDFGSMDPSYYFGNRKDVYHQDHVAGQFRNSYPELINCESFAIAEVLDLKDDMRCMVEVSVQAQGQTQHQHNFVFCMRRGTLGRKAGCWLTKMLVRGNLETAQDLIARLQKGLQ